MESIIASLMASPTTNLPSSYQNHGQGHVHQEAVERGLQPPGWTSPLYPTRTLLRKRTKESLTENILDTGIFECEEMDKESPSVWSYMDSFISFKSHCDKCGGPISQLSDPPSELTVYT